MFVNMTSEQSNHLKLTVTRGPEYAVRTLQDFMAIFIVPEIERRQEARKIERPFRLRAAQVVFDPEGRSREIRLNEEVYAEALVKIETEHSIEPGDPAFAHEIAEVELIDLSAPKDANSAHITLWIVNSTWHLAFDSRYNKARIRNHVSAAEEFYSAAARSRDAEQWHAYVENLFSAAELSSKCLLLARCDIPTRTNHRTIHRRINRLALTGNLPAEQTNAFNQLSRLRRSARYLDGALTLPTDEIDHLQQAVEALLGRAQAVVAHRAESDESRE